MSDFRSTWDPALQTISTSLSNPGATTTAIGNAEAADDEHGSRYFSTDKD